MIFGCLYVGILAGEFLGAVERGVRAFANAAGIRVVNEAALEDRLDDVAQCVVDHAIAEGRGRDQARLGIVDAEVEILAGPVFCWEASPAESKAIKRAKSPSGLERQSLLYYCNRAF